MLQGPLAADADDPAVADSDDEKKHKLEAQAARHHETLDIFAEQVGAAFLPVLSKLFPIAAAAQVSAYLAMVALEN